MRTPAERSFGAVEVTATPGGVRVRNRVPLEPYPDALVERLEHWARHAAERTFLAERDPSGAWLLLLGWLATTPRAFGQVFSTTHAFYAVAWVFAVAMIGFLYALCSSRIGRTLVAIKQNEPLVRAQGISPMPYKLAAFALSAAITGAAGGVFVFYVGIVDPGILDFYYMQTFLIIVIIGGAGSFWSVVVAGIVLSALPEALRFSADFRMIIYGLILVVAMFVMPTGVAGWLRERRIARLRASLQ